MTEINRFDRDISVTELLTNIDNNIDSDTIDRDVEAFSTYSDVSDWTGIPIYFNSLASLTSLVSNYKNWTARFNLAYYLVSCSNTLVDSIGDYSSDFITSMNKSLPTPQNEQLLRAVSMYVVLAHRLVVQLNSYVARSEKVNNMLKSDAKRGAKPAPATLEEIEMRNTETEERNWRSFLRQQLTESLNSLLTRGVNVDGKYYKKSIQYVFKPGTIDPEFLRLIIDTSLSYMDDPYSAKSSGHVSDNFNVFKTLIIDYDKADEIARRFIEKTVQLEYLRDVAQFPFIGALLKIVPNNSQQTRVSPEIRPLITIILQMVVALGRLSQVGTKIIASLILSLGENVPDVVLSRIVSFVSLLEHDSGLVRSSALQVLSDLLKSQYLTQSICQKFGHRLKQRNFIYQKMMAQLRDTNAQCRSKATHVWYKMMESYSIPMDLFATGLIGYIGQRLNDKSVMVRKSAVQFLTRFVETNPFGHDLSRRVNLDKMYELMRERKHMKNPGNSTVENAEARFQAKNAVLRVCIKKQVDMYVNGMAFGSLGLEGIEEQYENCIKKLLENPTPSITILMHIFAERNELPFLDPELEKEEQSASICGWVYERLYSDFIKNEVRCHNLSDEELVLEQQRIEDYNAKQAELRLAIQMCRDKLVIEEELKGCISLALRGALMGDSTELKDCVLFLTKCKQFNVRTAEAAIRSMCSLIWRRKKVTDNTNDDFLASIGEMFISNYNNTQPDLKDPIRDESTVDNLMKAMKGCEEHDRISVEESIFLLADSSTPFSKEVISKLWAIASAINRDDEYRIDALRILYCITRSKRGVVESRQRLRTLQRMLNLNSNLAYEALRVVSVLGTKTEITEPEDGSQVLFKLPAEDSFFLSLEQLFFKEMMNDTTDNKWFNIVQMTLRIIVNVSKDVNFLLPKFAGGFLYRARRIGEFYTFFKNEAENSDGVRKACATQRRDYWARCWILVHERLMAFIGEVVILIHEYVIITMPKMYGTYEKKMKFAHANDAIIPEEPPRFLSEMEYNIAKKNKIFDYSLEQQQSESDGFSSTWGDQITERRLYRKERLLGRLIPIVVYGLRAKGMPERVRNAASFAFGKMMTISLKHAEFAAPTFFSLLSRSPSPLVRANLLVTCSDIAIYHPNLFELYAPSLYKSARDIDPANRESAILVLTHLNAHSMIQMRGSLSESARCLCDDNLAVQSIASSFFLDLNRTGDWLISLLPDFIYRLACTGERLPFNQFQQIFDVLIGILREKPKTYYDGMIDKVCQKFGQLDSTLDANGDAPRYLAYALSKFTLSEQGFYKVRDNIRHWSRFLNHRAVAQHIKEMLAILDKHCKNDELKVEINALYDKIDQIQKEGLTNEILAAPATSSSSRRGGRRGRGAATPSVSGSRQKSKRKQKEPRFSESDSE